MANFDFSVEFSTYMEKLYSLKKLKIINKLCLAASNQMIAEELAVSVKAIEKSLTDLNKKMSIDSSLYSSRLRIIAQLLSEELCFYNSHSKLESVKNLNHNLRTTLYMTIIGLSNKTMAKLLNISTKAIEQRLSQLFDYFGIETKNTENENPRVLLMISANLRENISVSHFSKLVKKTSKDKLERIIAEPNLFVETITTDYSLIG